MDTIGDLTLFQEYNKVTVSRDRERRNAAVSHCKKKPMEIREVMGIFHFNFTEECHLR
jgi:hypothetical protein